MHWSDWLSALRTDARRCFDGAPPPLAQNLRDAARFVTGARRQGLRMAQLLGRDGIVARTHEGTLGGGGTPAPPLSLLYVGREQYAHEFERYFGAGIGPGPTQDSLLFRGGLAQFVRHKTRVARAASEVDLVACEAFPGGLVHDDDVEHYPMLEGHLRVERSIDQQIRRVRSRAERRLMRDILRRDTFRSWLDSSPEAFARFHSTLYAPYVRERFGAKGTIDDSEQLSRLYARSGRILFVAPRERPHEPVSGTLLLDGPRGTLAYQYNGFLTGAETHAATMAERTAALELAVMQYAIAQRFTLIAFGYTRAFLNDGLFTHKHRVGCTFAPLAGSPLFRLRARGGKRASIFARFPLLAGRPPDWSAVLGFDDSLPPSTKRTWRAALKSYRIAGLDRAVIWTNAGTGRAGDLSSGELAFREAVDEILDLPAGVEFRRPDERSQQP